MKILPNYSSESCYFLYLTLCDKIISTKTRSQRVDMLLHHMLSAELHEDAPPSDP